MIRAVALATLAVVAGCAQILGLDSTRFDYKDAMTDAPSVCDGAPQCTSTTGRSVCGQLFQVGASAGQPLRVATPTGMACSASDGPCAFAVSGQATASYFAGDTSDLVTGTVDDCGRFVVPDLDATQADVAIEFSAAMYNDSATLVLGRPTTPGTDTGIAAYAIDMTSATAWATTTGFLVSHTDTSGAPVSGDKDRLNGADLPAPPTAPWVAYFGGTAAFGAIDTTATETGPSGTSLVAPTTGTVTLSSARTGKTCMPMPQLQSVMDALIYVALSC